MFDSDREAEQEAAGDAVTLLTMYRSAAEWRPACSTQ